mmetsp:Transcript_119376/g.254709  ORF Transcript_119376/g.254709 Transcript_119376/m.254709 type:complete len:222 (-) Transcript_119376:361-1026(-)
MPGVRFALQAGLKFSRHQCLISQLEGLLVCYDIHNIVLFDCPVLPQALPPFCPSLRFFPQHGNLIFPSGLLLCLHLPSLLLSLPLIVLLLLPLRLFFHYPKALSPFGSSLHFLPQLAYISFPIMRCLLFFCVRKSFLRHARIFPFSLQPLQRHIYVRPTCMRITLRLSCLVLLNALPPLCPPMCLFPQHVSFRRPSELSGLLLLCLPLQAPIIDLPPIGLL